MMNGQVAAATCVAIILTALMQHVLQIIFIPVLYKRSSCPLSIEIRVYYYLYCFYYYFKYLQTGLPVGTMPFVLTTWLFIGLGKSSEGVFNYPITMSSPEGQRQELLSRQRTIKLEQVRPTNELNIYIHITCMIKYQSPNGLFFTSFTDVRSE